MRVGHRWAACVAIAMLWCAPDAAADVGYRGPAFTATSVVKPSGQKPQSKLWFHDGTWWGSLFAPVAEEYRVHRLDPLTQRWIDTGTPLDGRNSSEADVLWDGTHVYVASASDDPASPDPSVRVFRLTYDAANRAWVRDPSYTPTVAAGPVEAVVIDKDATGRLWMTFTRANTVWVARTNGGVWEAPFPLPLPDASGLDPDDISAVVAYGDRIGVLWSNQNAQAMYFGSYAGGAWTQTTALSGPFMADDHINLKSVQGGAGRVFAAVKTSASDAPVPDPADDQLDLLELSGGTWRTHRFGTVGDDHTRPIVLTDQLTRRLYVFATSPTVEAAGDQTIYVKETSLDSPVFDAGRGTVFLQGAGVDINDATSTKQDLSVAPQLVVLASDATNYWHNTQTLVRPTPTPTPTPTATPTPPPTTPPPPAPPAAPIPPAVPAHTADRAAPRITKLSVRPRRFRTRTAVRFSLSEDAKVRLGVERRASGRRVGGACVRRTRSNRKHRACTRYVVVRRGRARTEAEGRVRVRVNGRRLPRGRLRFVLSATDAAGNASAPRRIAARKVGAARNASAPRRIAVRASAPRRVAARVVR